METQKARMQGEEFIITRVFDAPRELVVDAWTQEKHLKEWFGPEGCAIVDLVGRMVIPGIHDAHCHMLPAGLKHRYEFRLPADALARVEAWLESHVLAAMRPEAKRDPSAW